MAFLKLLVFLTSFSLGCGLYEDQIGKFDWHRTMLGQTINVIWADPNTAASDVVLYTLTKSGALAAVRSTARISSSPSYHPENIAWRRMLEPDSNNLHLFKANKDVLVTVSSAIGSVHVRGWSARLGALIWDNTTILSPSSSSEVSLRAALVPWLGGVNIRSPSKVSAKSEKGGPSAVLLASTHQIVVLDAQNGRSLFAGLYQQSAGVQLCFTGVHDLRLVETSDTETRVVLLAALDGRGDCSDSAATRSSSPSLAFISLSVLSSGVVNFQGVAVVPVSTGAIGSCALVGSGASHAVCSVSPGSAAQSASPTLVHVCSRTRAVRALSLDLPLPEAASVGTSSSTPRINVRQVGASGSCSILRVEAHSTESQSQRTASTTVFWNERSEQLVAHPAIQGLLTTSILVDDEAMLSVLEQMSSNSSSSGSGDPTTKQQHRYRLSVYDSASAAQFCANADAAASSPRPTLVVNLENTRFASSERTPVLYFAHIQRKRSRTTGAAAESGTHVDEASGELLLRRALVLERDLALHYFGRNGFYEWTREESLSEITTAEFVDLPLADATTSDSTTGSSSDEEMGPDDPEAQSLPLFQRFFMRVSIQWREVRDAVRSLQISAKEFIERVATAKGVDWVRVILSRFSRDSSSIMDNDPALSDESLPHRDPFGLRKLIVVLTSSNTLFGIESGRGRIIWRRNLDHLEQNSGISSLSYQQTSFFVLHRTTHLHYIPFCILVASKAGQRGSTLIVRFDPMNGEVLSEEVIPVRTRLAFALSESYLQHVQSRFEELERTSSPLFENVASDEHHQLSGSVLHTRPLLLVDQNYEIHIYPKSMEFAVKELSLSNVFLFLVRGPNDQLLTGYKLQQDLSLFPLWQFNVGKDVNLVQLTTKPETETVHSVGRVLGDRRVLYKYLNPNLVAIALEGSDAKKNSFISIHLLDTVTGQMVYQTQHTRASGPIHLVLSEHWVVYSYTNVQSRRREIAVVELYEGGSPWNDTVYSSIARLMSGGGVGLGPTAPLTDPTPAALTQPAQPRILVLRQTYLLPQSSHISRARVTLSEHGVTTKSLIIALSNGAIVEMPKGFLDARRTLNYSTELQEEGVFPYAPEMNFNPMLTLTYNRTVERVKDIHITPTGLESTCLMFAHGMDLFSTRVSPARTYDVLKDEFEYGLIVAVTLGLLALALVARYLVQRRGLNRAWYPPAPPPPPHAAPAQAEASSESPSPPSSPAHHPPLASEAAN